MATPKHGEPAGAVESTAGDRAQALQVANNAAANGTASYELGDYLDALEYYCVALALLESAGDRRGVALLTCDIGNVAMQLGDNRSALEHQLQAAEVLTDMGDQRAAAHAVRSAGDTYRRMGEHERALEQYQAALAVHEECGNHAEAARTMVRIGIIRADMDELDAAKSQFKSARSVLDTFGSRVDVAWVDGEIGWLYARDGFDDRDDRLAEELLVSALGSLTQLGIKPLMLVAHTRLASLYESQARWEEAHRHLAASRTLERELYTLDAARRMEQIAHEAQIAELESRLATDAAAADATRDALDLRAKLLVTHIEKQQTGLASQAMHLARQTEMLTEFRSDLGSILRDPGDASAALERIRERLRQLPSEVIDWTRFDAQFRSTYPEFQTRLLQMFPTLSGMELKVCVLLKMKLTSADIAKLLSLSERSIEGHRLQIRRKMGLLSGEDVFTVLAPI